MSSNCSAVWLYGSELRLSIIFTVVLLFIITHYFECLSVFMQLKCFIQSTAKVITRNLKSSKNQILLGLKLGSQVNQSVKPDSLSGQNSCVTCPMSKCSVGLCSYGRTVYILDVMKFSCCRTGNRLWTPPSHCCQARLASWKPEKRSWVPCSNWRYPSWDFSRVGTFPVIIFWEAK